MGPEALKPVVAQIEKITDLLVPETADLVVTDGLHCGVEPTGGLVVDYLEKFPLERVRTFRMHPEAARAFKRYLGDRELGSKFDLSRLCGTRVDELDPEQKAALRFMKLMSEEDWQYWLGIDIHTSNWPNSNSLVIDSNNTPLSSIGVAGILGLTNVIVLDNYPFFNYFDKFVSIETELAPGRNPLSDPVIWHRHIGTIRDAGYYTLQKIGSEVIKDLRYFMQYDLMRVDKKGQVDPAGCRLTEQLEQLESPEACFEPVKGLPRYLKDLVPHGKQLCMGSWDDRNNSPELPELLGYREDGRPRRAAFGSFMFEISPPDVTWQ